MILLQIKENHFYKFIIAVADFKMVIKFFKISKDF